MVNPIKKCEEGSVLVISLAISAVILILLGVFLGSIVAEKRREERSYRSLQALNLAEAGIEKAIWELNNGDITNWNGTDEYRTTTVQLDGIGECTIAVSGPLTSNPVIVATGSIVGVAVNTSVKRTVQVEAQAGETVFSSALFAGTENGNGITIFGDIAIDSYNSEGVGKPYNPASASSNGDIVTNSTSTDWFNNAIIVIGTGSISGDAVVGPGGDPNQAIFEFPSGIVKGEKTSNDEVKTFSPVATPPIPSNLENGGDLIFFGNKEINESASYSSVFFSFGNLTVNPGAEFIYVEGDFSFGGALDTNLIINTNTTIYVNGDFNMLGNASIVINGNHKLTIYAGGNVAIAQVGNNTINTISKNPSNFALYGLSGCNRITLANLTFSDEPGFYGTVYAPNATIYDFGTVNICGSLVGNKIYLVGSNTKVHYDEALKNPVLNPAAPLRKGFEFVSGSWKEL